MNQQALKGQWNQIKGKIREKWGQLTDDELGRTEGNIEQVIGLIQRKTGDTRAKVESFLDEAAERGASMVNRISETAQEYAGNAAETVQNAATQAYDAAQEGVVQAQKLIQSKPVESLLVSFGAGLVSGIIVGLIIRSR
jgi:uncharacterized protein YjbJ (UPF0337 family)